MADSNVPLPFDPEGEPPDVDDDTPPEVRLAAAAHAHYLATRQALDMIDTSAYSTRAAGVAFEVVEAAQLQAFADHEAEDEEAVTADIPGFDS